MDTVATMSRYKKYLLERLCLLTLLDMNGYMGISDIEPYFSTRKTPDNLLLNPGSDNRGNIAGHLLDYSSGRYVSCKVNGSCSYNERGYSLSDLLFTITDKGRGELERLRNEWRGMLAKKKLENV